VRAGTEALRVETLEAPASWSVIDFIADLHLQAGEPETFDAWCRYMAGTRADAVFVLGDLFEVWIGDDAAGEPGFEQQCREILRATARRCAVHFMPGNRDFLVGQGLLAESGVRSLTDPTRLAFAGQHFLLSHGDALCIDDTEYQAFRQTVRGRAWQQDFLARPLDERRALARRIRLESESRKASGSQDLWVDVDTQTARSWLVSAGADTLIHGHTHRPAEHDLGDGLRRVVLSDWHLRGNRPHAEILRLTGSGLSRIAVTG